jgi:hypothetical protein
VNCYSLIPLQKRKGLIEFRMTVVVTCRYLVYLVDLNVFKYILLYLVSVVQLIFQVPLFSFLFTTDISLCILGGFCEHGNEPLGFLKKL